MRVRIVAMIALLSVCALVHAWPAWSAERMYVTDKLKINIRSGPSLEHRILAMVSSGEPVQVVESGDGWTKVVTADGTEGWTQSRMLVDEAPAAQLVDQFRKENTRAKTSLTEAQKELADLKERVAGLENELSVTSGNLVKTEEQYNALRSDSQQYLTLKDKYDRLKASSETQASEFKNVNAEYEKLVFSQRIQMALIGSAIFIVGWIIGYSVRRSSRKRGLLR